jgi:hypothetical protein
MHDVRSTTQNGAHCDGCVETVISAPNSEPVTCSEHSLPCSRMPVDLTNVEFPLPRLEISAVLTGRATLGTTVVVVFGRGLAWHHPHRPPACPLSCLLLSADPHLSLNVLFSHGSQRLSAVPFSAGGQNGSLFLFNFPPHPQRQEPKLTPPRAHPEGDDSCLQALSPLSTRQTRASATDARALRDDDVWWWGRVPGATSRTERSAPEATDVLLFQRRNDLDR